MLRRYREHAPYAASSRIGEERSTVPGRMGFAWAMAAEALCPVIVCAVVLHAISTSEWLQYVGRDMQIYATVAWFWKKGFIPYRDLYDFKPPLIYIALRVGYALCGEGVEGFRRVVLLLTAIGALAMYAGLRKAGRLIAAPLAALGFVTLMIADPWHVVSQNTELLVAVFGAAAFGCAAAYQQAARGRWALASGACLALATLAKQPAVVWALPVAAQLWLFAPRSEDWLEKWWTSRRAGLTALGLAALGFVAVIGLVAAYFAWEGAAKAFYQATVVDGTHYAGFGKVPWSSLATRPTTALLHEVLDKERMWPFVGAVGVLMPLTLLYRSRWAAVTWLWLLTSYAIAVIGPLREWHYLMSMFPALAIAAGMAFEMAVGGSDPADRAHAAKLLAGGVLIATLIYGNIWREDYHHPTLGSNTPLQQTLGWQIRQAARAGDTLFVKDEPFDLYVYADMPPMTRIIYPDSPAPGGRELWSSTLQRHPTFIFISHGTQERLATATAGFDADLAALLATHYERWLAHPIGIVYRRKGAAGH